MIESYIWPVDEVYFPALQGVGAAVVVAHMEPLGHGVQAELPANAYSPLEQSIGEDVPVPAHFLPAGHCVHAADPAALEYWPAGQSYGEGEKRKRSILTEESDFFQKLFWKKVCYKMLQDCTLYIHKLIFV